MLKENLREHFWSDGSAVTCTHCSIWYIEQLLSGAVEVQSIFNVSNQYAEASQVVHWQEEVGCNSNGLTKRMSSLSKVSNLNQGYPEAKICMGCTLGSSITGALRSKHVHKTYPSRARQLINSQLLLHGKLCVHHHTAPASSKSHQELCKFLALRVRANKTFPVQFESHQLRTQVETTNVANLSDGNILSCWT